MKEEITKLTESIDGILLDILIPMRMERRINRDALDTLYDT